MDRTCKIMPKASIHFRIEEEDKRFLERLVSSGTFSSLTDVCRRAIRDFKSKYTNEPTLTALDRQLQILKARVDRHEEEFREVRRKLAQDG